jgi:hypothetical protein
MVATEKDYIKEEEKEEENIGCGDVDDLAYSFESRGYYCSPERVDVRSRAPKVVKLR